MFQNISGFASIPINNCDRKVADRRVNYDPPIARVRYPRIVWPYMAYVVNTLEFLVMAYITDNNGSKVSVTINDVMQDIVNAINLTQDDWMQWYDEDDYNRENVTYDENGNYSEDTLAQCSYPLRLQVVDDSWYLHSGDPQYDTDHRGSWGYAYAYYGMNKTAIKDLAKELINDCDMWGIRD